MRQRKLGANGPSVGAIGLGCMSFAGFYGPTDVAESHRTLAKALELGVTHLDTARVYGGGLSEEVIGAFIRDHPGRFSIATKGGIRTAPTRGFDNSPEFLRECVEGSLKRLGVEHVDLYYVHRRDQSIPIEEVVGTLVRFKEEGKIGGIGFSEISPASLTRAAAEHAVMAVQSEYSLWSRLPELGMIQECARQGAAFVAFSPVARGMFAEIMPDPAAFRDGDFRKNNPRFMGENFRHNARLVGAFNDWARSRGWSPAAVALAWTLAQGEYVIPIPGTRSAEHLAEDAAGADLVLTAEDLVEIDRLLPVGFAHGDRYNDAQNVGPERYC